MEVAPSGDVSDPATEKLVWRPAPIDTSLPVKSRKAIDTSAQQPGYCHYPNIIKYNEARQARATAHQCSGSSSALLSEILDPEDLPLQLVLFDELADDGDTEEYCHAAEAV
jgi:hypothetical protein